MRPDGGRLRNNLKPRFCRDEGGPLGVALQEEIPNRRKPVYHESCAELTGGSPKSGHGNGQAAVHNPQEALG